MPKVRIEGDRDSHLAAERRLRGERVAIIDLTAEEMRAVVGLIRNELESTRFPLSPKSQVRKRARDKMRAVEPTPSPTPKRRTPAKS